MTNPLRSDRRRVSHFPLRSTVPYGFRRTDAAWLLSADDETV